MSTNISLLLKSKRRERGLSVKEVREYLRNKNIDVSDKTIYGWESGHRQPDADTFVTLCQIYKIESFSEMNNVEDDGFCYEEWDHIKKYRALDKPGKEIVDIVLEKEAERMESEQKAHASAEIKAGREQLEAAEERPTSDDGDGLIDLVNRTMEFVLTMNPNQKQMYLEHWRKLLEQQKEALEVAAPLVTDGSHPVFDCPNQSSKIRSLSAVAPKLLRAS